MDSCKKQKLYKKATELLERYEVSSLRVGYEYISEAIVYVICNGIGVAGITKTLYPYLAKKFCTSPSAVERAIRMAITDACKTDNEYIRELCNTKDGYISHITNKEFIYKSVKNVKMQLEISNNDEY